MHKAKFGQCLSLGTVSHKDKSQRNINCFRILVDLCGPTVTGIGYNKYCNCHTA